jgi:hypothetical protein
MVYQTHVWSMHLTAVLTLLQGVSGCLQEELTVGETYSISFVLLGWSASGAAQTIKRYITIAPACPPGEWLCGGACSPVPCTFLPELAGDAETGSRLPAGTTIELIGPPTLAVRATSTNSTMLSLVCFAHRSNAIHCAFTFDFDSGCIYASVRPLHSPLAPHSLLIIGRV